MAIEVRKRRDTVLDVMELFTQCQFLAVILMSFIEVMQSQSTFPYHVETSRTAPESHLVLRCGMKCNLEEFCKGFLISSAEADPCILLFEHLDNSATVGNEVFCKEKQGE